MGWMDSIKNFMTVNDDLDDGENYGYDDDENTEEDNDVYSYSDSQSKEMPSQKGRYLNIHANSQLSVVLVKPESFAEASSIADHLNQKRTVVLNLESTGKDVSRRLVDFLSGAAYANKGTLKRVANSTFIITPNNVDIMGDTMLEDLSDNSGIYI